MKVARITADLTVTELAEGAGLNRSTVSRVEAGRFIPRARTLRKILRVLRKASDGVARRDA